MPQSSSRLPLSRWVRPSGRHRRRALPVMVAASALIVAAAVVTGAADATEHTAPATGRTLPVSAVAASGDDGSNGPGRAVDGDLSTRWSGGGEGAWIQLDLGESANVTSVRIAWYHGDEREATFEVQTSENGNSWTTVYERTSGGHTSDYESYDVTDSAGRYVRIVGSGNTVNDWTSILEVDVLGSGGDGPGYDPNGVRQLYPTDPDGASPWVLGYDDWWDRAVQLPGKWLDDEDTTVEISGSGRNTVVTAGGDQIRLYAAATSFHPDDHCDGDNDLERVLSDGYMCSPKDWRNYEITGYFQLVEPDPTGEDTSWQMYGNGGRHTNDDVHRCKGTAYKSRVRYDSGEVQLRREGPHPEYGDRDFDGRKAPDYTDPDNRDRWLGMKLVRYEVNDDGERVVRLEMYLDTSGVDADGDPRNDWELVATTEDRGGWADQLDRCGLDDDQIMLWGGPWIGWRWDETTSSIRLMSVREIVPPTS